MKKYISLILAFVFVVGVFATVPLTPIANAASIDDLVFELNEEGTMYQVKDCNNASGELVIPSTYNGLPVTKIGSYAFEYCRYLTSVTIPDSVTIIGSYAFHGCGSLTSVTIPDSVTIIGSWAFHDCTHLTSVTIPDSVTSIGDAAFHGCGSLTSVTIPDSVTIIGSWAFHNCTHLTSVTIPDSVTSIGRSAFHGCGSLTNVTIPDSVTSIGDAAFGDCTSLTNVTIPDSVKSIGTWAFDGCTSLTNVTIPDSVTSIGDETFDGCASLTNVTIPDSVTSIGGSAFRDCTSLTNVTIPDSVIRIGDDTFYGCTSLTSLIIPESVTYIGEKAFGYKYDSWEEKEEKIPGFTIYGVKGSAAEKYANENEIVFVEFDGTMPHDHTYVESITQQPTYTETGIKTFTCFCGDSYTEVIPKLNLSLGAPVITSATISNTGVTIKWDAVANAEEYKIYRKVYNPSTKKWDKSWKAVKTGLTTTEYVDGSVILGTQYKYLVKAVNGDLTKNSAESSVVTFKISPTPKAYIKSNGIKIKWSTVVSAESYIIYRAEYNDSKGKYNSYKKMTTVNGSTKEWTDTKAASGKKYKYCLKAVKGSVVCSKAQSNSMYFLTKTTVKAAKAKTGVKVSWTEVKGATSFKIYRSELQNGAWTKFSQVGTAKSNVKSFTDTTVVSGVQYKYKVKAIKSKTGQTSSETAAYLYLVAPEVTAVKGTDCINVTWTESAGATEYVVYRSTYDAKKKKWSSFKKQTTVNATTTSYKDTNAKSGTKYKYCVKAKNGSVVSAYLTSESVKA